MTIEDLQSYRKLQKKAITLAKRIEFLENKPSTIVTDSVRGSARYSPYQEHIITITGLGGNHKATCARLKRRLDGYGKALQEKLADIEQFIDSVECDDISHILECYYVRCMTWEETAKEVYEYASLGTPRMAVKRYFASA